MTFRIAAALLFALSCASASAQPSSFQSLGFFAEGNVSEASAVSADGVVIVGSMALQSNGIPRAFRWTEAGGLQSLGVLPGGNGSFAHGVSSDGSVVVGRGSFFASGSPQEAFRWAPGGGLQGMGFLPGGSGISRAFGVSGDGSVVVGVSRSGAPSGVASAFRWEGGTMQPLGATPGCVAASAWGVSSDGATVVGTSCDEAVRWTDGSVPEALGVPPGGGISRAQAVTADGSAVFGWATFGSGGNSDAARWTAAEGWVSLGRLPGFDECFVRAVSADGATAVGECIDYTRGVERAFLWTAASGIRSLRDALEQEFGLDVTGWDLREANGISASGTVIAGTGEDPAGFQFVAWRAVLGTPVASESGAAAPEAFAVDAPFPNPVHTSATLRVALPEASALRADVFDALGRRVLVLADGERAAGVHDLRLDAAGLPSGPYLVRVTAGDEVAVVRLVVTR